MNDFKNSRRPHWPTHWLMTVQRNLDAELLLSIKHKTITQLGAAGWTFMGRAELVISYKTSLCGLLVLQRDERNILLLSTKNLHNTGVKINKSRKELFERIKVGLRQT